MKFKKVVLILAIGAVLPFTAIRQSEAAWNVWSDHAIIKIKQNGLDAYNNQVHSGNQSISIKMAKNEFESFQIFIYADGESLSNVDVSTSPITNGSNEISDVYFYKEWYTNCPDHSRPDYKTGYYPTALLPKVDRYYGEIRNTFPFNVTAGNVQGVWVDIGTEINTAPGNYQSTITITAEGKSPVNITLFVEVWDFTLPSTATFDSMFAILDGFLSYQHMGSTYNSTVNNKLYPLYAKMALYHRISTRPTTGQMGITYEWSASTKKLTNLNPGNWETYYRKVLDGTAISTGPYAGAKAMSSVVPRWGSNCVTDSDDNITNTDKPTAAIQYLQAWYDYFGTNGWSPANHLYVTVEDEPKTTTNLSWRGKTVTEVEKALTQAEEASQIDTSIYGDGAPFKYVLMNAHNESHLSTFQGLYNPWVGHYAPANWEQANENSSYIFPRASYPQADKYWAYMSCMSNGCTNGTDTDLISAMDLSADAPAILNRIFSFYYWKQELTGFWYFQLNGIFNQDPYGSLWPADVEGSNGDGNLVYPGVAGEFVGTPHGGSTPNIGGTHDIPIAGIRLKYIRDAMEDMEYFKLAEEQAGKATVDNIVDTMFTNTNINLCYWNLNESPVALLNARSSIANLIEGNTPPPPLSIIITPPEVQ